MATLEIPNSCLSAIETLYLVGGLTKPPARNSYSCLSAIETYCWAIGPNRDPLEIPINGYQQLKQIHGKKEVMLRNVQRIGNWELRRYLKNQFVVNDTIHLG